MTAPPSPVFPLEPVDWDDPRAVELRRRMDADMTARYGGGAPSPEPAELTRKRNLALAVDPAQVRATILAVTGDGIPVGHIGLRILDGEWEVKRLIVDATVRRAGIGSALLTEVLRIAGTEGASRVILQAGDRQPEAVALYERFGFTRIPVYEPYRETMPQSICFELLLSGGSARDLGSEQ